MGKAKKLASVVGSGIILTSSLFSDYAHAGISFSRPLQKQDIVQLQNKNEVSTTELIKLGLLEGYLSLVFEHKENKSFKGIIEEKGLGNVAEFLTKTRCYWVDLADQYVRTGDKSLLSYRNLLEISRKIGQEQRKFHDGDADELALGVVMARARVGRLYTDYFIKLIGENHKQFKKQDFIGQYDSLVKNSYTAKEFTKHCSELSDATENYYDELGKTLGWKIIFGWKDIDNAKKLTRNYFFEKRDRLYLRKE